MNLLFSPSKQARRGQGLVEYAIILALVAIIVIVVVRVVGPKVGNTFSTINNSLPGDTASDSGGSDDGDGDDGGGDNNGTWTPGSGENSSFNLPAGNYEVQYGANGSFYYRYFTGPTTINCNNATFGDPIVGTLKSCSYR
ncbi:MAG: hypothetical protein U0V48_14095 [Anaerolineales bacterium]